MTIQTAAINYAPGRDTLEAAVVRFAGDSGDGIQLTGGQFTQATAAFGNDLATFPDFPAEIRAPVGTTYGVSAYQIHFGTNEVSTPGDQLDALVALNPAALKTNLKDLAHGGLLIIDSGTFNDRNLKKASYDSNPLEDDSLLNYRVLTVDISKLTLEAVKPFGLSHKESLRCKNFWTLGLVMWLFGRDKNGTINNIQAKFANSPKIAESNVAALNAGHIFGDTAELPIEISAVQVPKAHMAPGLYRNITGSQALAWGIAAASQLADLPVTFASYPITPASTLLHYLVNLRAYGITTFQAEDEIAAVCAAIGASFAGSLGVTSSSGPGIALKTEAIALAHSAELPLLVINTQRAGPSTGMPTKTEQSDLMQAMFGRHGDTPLPVIAAASPSDCFDTVIEAVRIATKYMTPVIFLSDGYIANAMEPWSIPDFSDFTPFKVDFHTKAEGFHPFQRQPTTLARAWAIPGTKDLEHRIGGIEKDYNSGNISYDPDNHQLMTDTRAAKVKGISADIPSQTVSQGKASDVLAVLGWGSTFGAIHQAVERCRQDGLDIAHIHIRHLNPFPVNLGTLLQAFEQILVPEMNSGQLLSLIRAEYLIDAKGLNKISGQPFKIGEVEQAIRDCLRNKS